MNELTVVLKDKNLALVMMFDKDVNDINEDDIKAAIDAGKYELSDSVTIDRDDKTAIYMGFGKAGEKYEIYPQPNDTEDFWYNLFSKAFAD